MISRTLLRSLPALLVPLLIPLVCFSTTYYVDSGHPSASDANPGTQASPWLTLQHAADTAQPGDSVRVMAGTYTSVTFYTTGSSQSPITFMGESMASVIIDGGMEVYTDVSYMNISGFSLVDNFTWGVFLRGTNHHITLTNMTVSGGDNGFHLTWGYQGEDPLDGPVSDIIIEDCLVEGGTFTGVDCTPGPCDDIIVRNVEVGHMGSEAFWGADGIAFERGEFITVEDCYVHDNAGDGIDIGSRDHDGYVDGVVVRRNRVVRNYSNGIKVWAGGRIENNIVWGQGNTPVALGAFPGTYEMINNTVAYNMVDPEFGLRNYSLVMAYPDNETGISAACDLTFVNNIFAYNCDDDHGGPTGLYFGEGVTLVEEGHNLFWSREDGEIQADFLSGDPWFSREMIGDGTWAAATGQGEGNVTSDPLFASTWPAADLHLTSGSPAINTGSSAGPATDVEGQSRPSGGGYDIGAYEYQSSVQAPVAAFTATPAINQGSTCQVHFTDQSSGTISTWTWDFGDGGTSSGQHPDHTYECNGPYAVSLTVAGPGGSDTETKPEFIECACPCQLSLTSPNGEEIWCADESEGITWQSGYTGGQVRIQYSINNGGTWLSVASSTPDDGLFTWAVPDNRSALCLIKISAVDEPSCSDVSDRSFRICGCDDIAITPTTLPHGTRGCPYEKNLTVSGGCDPYEWSVFSGSLPDGVELDPASGTLTGEPGETGSFSFTLLVEDVLGRDDQNGYTLLIDEYENRKADVNGTCTIDILDVVVLINVILTIHQPDGDETWRCDCNGPPGVCEGDGVVNIMDAMKIVGLILGTDSCP